MYLALACFLLCQLVLRRLKICRASRSLAKTGDGKRCTAMDVAVEDFERQWVFWSLQGLIFSGYGVIWGLFLSYILGHLVFLVWFRACGLQFCVCAQSEASKASLAMRLR